MSDAPRIDPAALLDAIASARKHATHDAGSKALQLERRYETSYWVDQEEEWIPRIAEIDAVVTGSGAWVELEIGLATGPKGIYPYFPFTSYIYVDGVAQAILEFTSPEDFRLAVVTVAVGRSVTIAIVSELASPPSEAEERELALILRHVRVGRSADGPPPSVTREHVNEYAMQGAPLIEKIPAPVFVVGAYRSGTSILTWALGQHPNIWPLDETRWLQLLGSGALAAFALATNAPVQFFDTYNISRREYMAYLGSAIDRFMLAASNRRANEVWLKRLHGDPRFDERFQLRRSALTPKQRWVDGTPENADCILLLHELFPEAKFVCLLREPREVVASMVHFDRAGGEAMDLETAAAMWIQKTKICLLAYRALGPEFVRVVHYDALSTPEKPLREIFQFLGEPDFPTSASTFDRPINTSTVNADERSRVFEAFERLAVAREASALYAQFQRAVGEPWSYDSSAYSTLLDAQNELISRMVEAVI